jgi:hypothetical protein
VPLLGRGGQRSRMGFVGEQLLLDVGHAASLPTGSDGLFVQTKLNAAIELSPLRCGKDWHHRASSGA